MVKKETDIVKECKDRLHAQPSSYGVSMDIFEFVIDNTASNRHKGHSFHVTKEERISFEHGQHYRKPCIKLSGGSKSVDAVFCIHGIDMKPELEAMRDRSFTLKNDTILKILFCVENAQMSQMVTGLANFDQTLDEYLIGLKDKIARKVVALGDYLPGQAKDLISTGWIALLEIWENGYTSDVLDRTDSYVMVGEKMKILPFVIRLRRPDEENIMVLKLQYANLLQTNFAPIWSESEVYQLINLMRNPLASMEDVLGHPVLSSALRRQILYRILYSRHMSPGQLLILRGAVQINSNWQQVAQQMDPVLKEMIDNGGYVNDVSGALEFGRKVSAHYTQERKEYYKKRGITPPPLDLEMIDKLLKRCLAGVLCGRYALKCDAAYENA